MKFNRTAIMQTAWKKHRRFDLTFAQALRLAWMEAKLAAARYDVWGQCIGGEPELIASNVGDERASELEWLKKPLYDRVWRRAA